MERFRKRGPRSCLDAHKSCVPAALACPKAACYCCPRRSDLCRMARHTAPVGDITSARSAPEAGFTPVLVAILSLSLEKRRDRTLTVQLAPCLTWTFTLPLLELVMSIYPYRVYTANFCCVKKVCTNLAVEEGFDPGGVQHNITDTGRFAHLQDQGIAGAEPGSRSGARRHAEYRT